MSCAGGMFPTWEESPESQAGVHFPFPTRVGNFGKFPTRSFPVLASPCGTPPLGGRLPDHAMHADHGARHQLEREEAALLDPARQLDVERKIAAEAELIVVLRIADQDDAAVALQARLRHRVPHQRLAVS